VSVEVRPVKSRRDLARFVEVPFRLYRDDPVWVPPLRAERKLFLSRRQNPFFEHGEAEYLLAWRDGEPAGRVSAHVDRSFNDYHDNRWGMFGFFETENDPEVAGALLDAASGWLRERGRDRAVGPMDFQMNDESGILVEGFGSRPMIRQPYHPPHYSELVEGAGFTKAMDLLMWNLEVDNRDNVLPIVWELADKLEPEHGVTLRHMRKRDAKQEMRRFNEIFHSAWSQNWGFTPYTDKELDNLALEFRLFMDEDWTWLAEKDGQVVAAAITVPDVNQRLAPMNGRLLPLGWWRYLTGAKRIDRVRVGFLGVRPEFQHTGVAAALYKAHFDMAERKPQRGGEMGWILETNTAMNRGMEAMGGRVVKRYRVYEKAL
jgi:GNAT superfamily N-acetyltransferase